jgi:hypothetical protein
MPVRTTTMKKQRSQRECRLCGAGVNPPQRVHPWCRPSEPDLRREERRIYERQNPNAPSHTFPPSAA